MLTSTHILATGMLLATCIIGWLALLLAEERQRSGLYRHRMEAAENAMQPVDTVSRSITAEDTQP